MDRTAVRITLFTSLLLCAASGQAGKEQDVDIYSFHINSTVTSRYAITVITSRVANRLNESKEIHFEVKIPKNAFISKFRMTIEEKTYDGVVKKKEEAQQQYSDAVSRGESAGMISSVGRTLEEFKTSVTVAALSKVTFELTYEELLQRRHGKYDLLINAQPMQPVADFKIDVYIHESPGISFLEVKGGLNTKDLTNAVTTTRSVKEAWVNFYPTRDQQTSCDVCGKQGMNGDLIITYDVERPKPSGELRASDGYFVHYFAPTDVERIPKNVVFVIDRSGSMSGKKIQQTREALLKILGDVAEDDYFGLITFDSKIEVWRPELVQATDSNLKSAKNFVKKITDRGATDINAAVLKGVEMINRHQREGSASILILLTDGAPNTGVSHPPSIQANVKEAIGGKFPLYCLGFGFDVNYDFLEKMALENSGRAFRIYEDSDADLQLQGFYKTVAVPLLIDVNLNYPGAANLTQSVFRYYYNGSEIVVAGQITDNSLESFQTEVIAISKNDKVTYQESVIMKELDGALSENENVIQRLWAYLTVKQLLEKEMTLGGQEKDAVKEEALKLSLQYQFVTPLTSMVVTKPQGEKTQIADKPKEGEKIEASSRLAYSRPSSRRNQPSGGSWIIPSLANHPGPQLLLESASEVQSVQNSYVPESPQTSSVQRSAPGRVHGLMGQGDVQNSYVPESPQSSSVQRSGDSSGRLRSRIRPMSKSFGPLPHPTIPSAARRHRKPRLRTLPSVVGARFLISDNSQPKPLCYDLPPNPKLRLLKDPPSDFSMNGKLTLTGFKRIIIHYGTKHQLNLSSVYIRYTYDLNTEIFAWGQTSTKHGADSVSLILSDNELDVTMGTVRVVFFRHKKDGEWFLWPAVQQQPNNANAEGIFGKKNLQYEELPGSMIKINNVEVKATWSSANDYRRSPAPALGCWLVPYQIILGGNISNFTVSRL
ncbi:inter-alpha-trypsin inhibitor heavy chain H3 isoform X23 [Astyanax mexicanus]|uniref:inter-alpha-trypsin inhibitor heavy chain H3 isoform X23 n=1 Tax=Astyanax mexicanus TaxID=7994 RepID=UPI0020CAB12C|nr:inter-alpha-trypsin inhibitor heavy chain H3 isoform X23 [Astyanax mexicanus]